MITRMKTILAADLFCGAGGSSSGAQLACDELGFKLKLIAINHWDKAIATHSMNHPNAEHYCASLELINPRDLVGIGKLDLLIASPECIHHSTARGGRPINDQSRATAWCVTRWAEAVLPKAILVENVPEFLKWGPLVQKRIKGKLEWVPDPKRKGATFISWIQTLESLGYRVEWRKLVAANHGDPTSRERLFIQARRDRKPIRWPAPTHAPQTRASTMPLISSKPLLPYRTAREIIDWSIASESIFDRKKPLAPNTMTRIWRGLEKFSGLPFIVPQMSGGENRSVEQPLQTITTTSRGIGLCQPFIVVLRSHQDAQSLDEPINTICGSGAHHALCEPFIVGVEHTNANGGQVRAIDNPLPTVTGRAQFGLAQPYIIAVNHGKDDSRSYSLDQPMPTVTSVDAWALAQPYLIKFNGTGGAHSLTEPLDTVTVKDRFGLVQPECQPGATVALLDIKFRMLQPHELAAAMSFPKSYHFVGTREERVKQIGNAVPVQTAKALCKAILG